MKVIRVANHKLLSVFPEVVELTFRCMLFIFPPCLLVVVERVVLCNTCRRENAGGAIARA